MRALAWLLVVGLASVAVMGVLASLAPFYHSPEERDAFRAFTNWRENPSAETEERWKMSQEKALRKEMKFRGLAFTIGAVAAVGSGFGAYRLRRSARQSTRIPLEN